MLNTCVKSFLCYLFLPQCSAPNISITLAYEKKKSYMRHSHNTNKQKLWINKIVNSPAWWHHCMKTNQYTATV